MARPTPPLLVAGPLKKKDFCCGFPYLVIAFQDFHSYLADFMGGLASINKKKSGGFVRTHTDLMELLSTRANVYMLKYELDISQTCIE